MKVVQEPTETSIIKTKEDSRLKKEVTNMPCACFEKVYIVKRASHKIRYRFNESQSISKTVFVCVIIDKLLTTDMEMHKMNILKKKITKIWQRNLTYQVSRFFCF